MFRYEGRLRRIRKRDEERGAYFIEPVLYYEVHRAGEETPVASGTDHYAAEEAARLLNSIPAEMANKIVEIIGQAAVSNYLKTRNTVDPLPPRWDERHSIAS